MIETIEVTLLCENYVVHNPKHWVYYGTVTCWPAGMAEVDPGWGMWGKCPWYIWIIAKWKKHHYKIGRYSLTEQSGTMPLYIKKVCSYDNVKSLPEECKYYCVFVLSFLKMRNFLPTIFVLLLLCL